MLDTCMLHLLELFPSFLACSHAIVSLIFIVHSCTQELLYSHEELLSVSAHGFRNMSPIPAHSQAEPVYRDIDAKFNVAGQAGTLLWSSPSSAQA